MIVIPWLAIGAFALDTLRLLLNPKVWLIAGLLTLGGYVAGRIEGRSICNDRISAAALKEQRRQAAIATEESAKADRLATTIIQRDTKRDAEINILDQEAAAAPGADAECLDAGSVRRVDRVR
jgi:hypothetical protein